MAKNETALDRLERTKLPSNEREFTLEEQMDSVSTDDFLDGMSDVARDNLGHLIEEVTTESVTETEEPVIAVNLEEDESVEPEPIMVNEPSTVDKSQDELFNNNMKPKRTYRKRSEESNQVSQPMSSPKTDSSNPLLDQLSKDVIDELRSRCFKINRFDDKSMEMIFNYMYNKF